MIPAPLHRILDRQRRAEFGADVARTHMDRYRASPMTRERDFHQACVWQEFAAHEAMLARQAMGVES